MKLFQINSTLNWGSTGRIAEEIGQAVMTKGWESCIAYGRYYNESLSQSIKIGDDWNVYNHVLQTRLFDNHGLASREATKHLIGQIKEISPNIIHLHNIHGYYLNYPILFDFLSKSDIPVVWTLHDCWSFTGHCSHYSYAGCKRWCTLCHDCPQKRVYPSSWLIDRSEPNFRDKLRAFTSVKNMTLVPVSEWLADEVKQSFLREYPIRVIHNGIDTDIFTPMQTRKSDLGIVDKFLILGVANIWTARKGLTDFIRLSENLSDEYVIVLIGLDEKQIKTLPENIIGIKRTNSVQDLAKYYSVADVFLNPTWEDNFPTTNLEALACGTPVITYQTGGSVEAVDNETGFIVEQGGVFTIVNVIEQIRNSEKKRWSSACRKRAVELYDKRKRYVEYLQLYEELIDVR